MLVALADRLDLDVTASVSSKAVFDELSQRVPLYAGITIDRIGGDGVRWQDCDPQGDLESIESIAVDVPELPVAQPEQGLVLTTRASLWTAPEAEHSPILEFLRPQQELLVNPADARRLGVRDGEVVSVSSDGRGIEALVRVTVRAPAGAVYLIEGTRDDNANLLIDGDSGVGVEVAKADRVTPDGLPDRVAGGTG